MKLELDFDNKIITVKATIEFSELKKKVKKLGLKDWSVQCDANYYYYPNYPIYYGTGQTNIPTVWTEPLTTCDFNITTSNCN